MFGASIAPATAALEVLRKCLRVECKPEPVSDIGIGVVFFIDLKGHAYGNAAENRALPQPGCLKVVTHVACKLVTSENTRKQRKDAVTESTHSSID
jgi:hypothetical protein